LLVQRINGVATQQGIVIRFNPITPREWWEEFDHPQDDKLWKLQKARLETMAGKTFEMRGYERGEHVGKTQEDVLIQIPVQFGEFEYRLSFRPLMMKAIEEVHFTPTDFVDRVAEFEGRAETRGGAGWMTGADGLGLAGARNRMAGGF
jgi:hypothetical protein